MKHLKLFNLKSEYDSYKESSDFVTPNVSLIEGVGIQYNPITPSQIKGIYVVEDISNPVRICQDQTLFKSIKIDGNEVSLNTNGAYQFDVPGTFTVEFKLKDITRIGDCAFQFCSSLTAITIPEGVTSIGDWAFEGCSSLTAITLPEGVTSIGNEAFSNCSNLVSISIPQNSQLTSIGTWAFNTCSSLTAITIPASVPKIGTGAFLFCNSLTSITCHAMTPPTIIGTDTFLFVDESIPVYVPASSVEAYKVAEGWKNFTNIQAIPEI